VLSKSLAAIATNVSSCYVPTLRRLRPYYYVAFAPQGDGLVLFRDFLFQSFFRGDDCDGYRKIYPTHFCVSNATRLVPNSTFRSSSPPHRIQKALYLFIFLLLVLASFWALHPPPTSFFSVVVEVYDFAFFFFFPFFCSGLLGSLVLRPPSRLTAWKRIYLSLFPSYSFSFLSWKSLELRLLLSARFWEDIISFRDCFECLLRGYIGMAMDPTSLSVVVVVVFFLTPQTRKILLMLEGQLFFKTYERERWCTSENL